MSRIFFVSMNTNLQRVYLMLISDTQSVKNDIVKFTLSVSVTHRIRFQSNPWSFMSLQNPLVLWSVPYFLTFRLFSRELFLQRPFSWRPMTGLSSKIFVEVSPCVPMQIFSDVGLLISDFKIKMVFCLCKRIQSTVVIAAYSMLLKKWRKITNSRDRLSQNFAWLVYSMMMFEGKL